MAADGFAEIAIVFGHFEKHVLPPLGVAGKTGCFRIMLSARAV
ncbi:hypothetical protein [Bradyrhizobium liaoningense]|nr:hypothetical protein [Bradyrhizobium liaoningense]